MLASALGWLHQTATWLLTPEGLPEEDDLCFLRLAATLSSLALAVYEAAPGGARALTHVHLPAGQIQRAGPQQGARLALRLLHLQGPSPPGPGGQEQRGCAPQQWALYSVEGLGQALVFRGTAALVDCVCNASITPQPLPVHPELQALGVRLQLHSGFLQGVLPHVPDIAAAVRRARRGSSGAPGLWLTGHSLGGAYATALALVLLADPSYHDLLAGGGGVVTFGAPFVAFSTQPDALYSQLSTLLGWSRMRLGRPFHIHHIVNGMDLVPRLLGGAMARVHGLLEARLPGLASVRRISEHYFPLGQYHFLLGGRLRTLPQQQEQEREEQEMAAGGAGTSSEAQLALESSRSGGRELAACRGGAGSLSYARLVAAQLEVSGVWRAALLAAGEAGMLTDHSMQLHKARLAACLEAAAAAAAAAGPGGAGGELEQDGSGDGISAGRSWAPNRSSPSVEQRASLFKAAAAGRG